MRNLKKIIIVGLCLAFSLVGLTACGSQEVPELTKSKITQDLETELKEAAYSYDSLDNFEYEKVDVTEDDLSRLKEFFDNRVDYQKIDCSFQLTSIKMDSIGEWSMIYAYVNGEWQVMFSYQKDPSAWEYVAKETVSSKKMLNDLKTVTFEGFETGYVGSEKSTSIKIVDRDTKFKINKDDVYIDVTVKTDFATYIIEVEMIYYFDGGEWELSDAIVQDSKYWQLTYNSDRVPSAPSEVHILEQLTKETNFLTYVADTSYMERYDLVETKQLAGVTTITFQYEFSTIYKNIGTIKYLVQLPYEWIDGEWAIGDMVVTVSDMNLNGMLGTWTAPNGDYIKFTLTENDPNATYPSPNILVGTYYKKTGENTFAEYTLKTEVSVPLRDNNWDGKIKLWEAKDISSVEFSIENFLITTDTKILKSGELEFIKTADLPTIDIEGNPEGEETSTETTTPSETTPPSESTETPSSETSETVDSTESTESSENNSSETTSEEKTETSETTEDKTGISG